MQLSIWGQRWIAKLSFMFAWLEVCSTAWNFGVATTHGNVSKDHTHFFKWSFTYQFYGRFWWTPQVFPTTILVNWANGKWAIPAKKKNKLSKLVEVSIIFLLQEGYSCIIIYNNLASSFRSAFRKQYHGTKPSPAGNWWLICVKGQQLKRAWLGILNRNLLFVQRKKCLDIGLSQWS